MAKRQNKAKPPKAPPKAPPKVPPKSKQQIEEEADKARKAKVDATNKKRAEDAAEQEAKTACVLLNDEELAFIARIAPMMNKGRMVDQPSPAEILRYSQLKKREGIKQPLIGLQNLA